MKKVLTSFLAAGLFLSTVLSAYDDSPPCFKDMELNFFSYDLVSYGLSMHLINQGQWQTIYNNLQDRVKVVPDTVRAQANTMDPNPIEYPFQPKEATDLLMGILFQIYRSVLVENGIRNESKIIDMFNDIKRRQKARLEACF